MAEATRTVQRRGFDPGGEPVVRVTGDGSPQLRFEFMPPSGHGHLGPCDDFDKQIEKAIGFPVAWDDRDVFLVPRPNPDTVETLRAFVEVSWG